MTIRFRFIDATTNTVISDSAPLSGSVEWNLNQSENWSASFPKNILAVQNLSEGNDVEIYDNDRLIISGTLQNIAEKWSNDTIALSLSGRGRIDDIYNIRAYSQAYYEDKELVLVLGELLRIAGWRIGKINTLTDPLQKVTVDLRSEKRLLAQVVSLIEGIPATFFRYGGNIVNKDSIDIGSFEEDSGISLYRPADSSLVKEFGSGVGAITSLDKNVNLTEIVNSVEVIGGDVRDNTGVTRTVTLKDALVANPSLAADPNYPIVTQIANFVYYIRNLLVPTTLGSQSTERFTQYSPPRESGNATLAAINAAGLALYKRGVAYLQDHQSNSVEYNIDAVGDDLYISVGDTVYIKSTIKQPIIDPFSDEITFVESEINGDIRVTNSKLEFSGDKINWSFKLVDNATIIKQEDIFVSVYDETKRETPPAGVVYAPSFTPVVATITTPVSGLSSNTTLDDGTSAANVTITLPGAPVGATGVYLAGIPFGTSPNGTLLVELVSDPEFPSTNPVVKVAIKNAGWLNPFTATLTTYIVWI